jgi:hypothetical protein
MATTLTTPSSEARHQRVTNHDLLFGIIEVANSLDMPVYELTDEATARAVGALLEAALGSLRAVDALCQPHEQ